jgi:hypothetical protein
MNRPAILAVIAILLFGDPGNSRADSIELINGDLLHGKVVSLDDVELRLISDIHGAVIIARDKVAVIGFGERKLVRPAAASVPDGTPDAQGVVRRTAPGDQSQVTATVPLTPLPAQDVLRQLRAQGLTAENIAELQKALPMLKEPAARRFFDEKVKGLTEGTINVQDIRKEAMRAREEYRKTAKSLGPDGEKALNQALGGYLDILDRFIRDSAPKTVTEGQPTPLPGDSDKKPKPEDGKPQETKTETPAEAPKSEAKEESRS